MPSFADSIFLFVLALLLFGPKKLPVLARELGKWVGEFRRASNEFKMQMEDELRASEQTERQKQIAAMEAAAPIPPPLAEPAEEEHPHLRSSSTVPPPPAPDPLGSVMHDGPVGDNSQTSTSNSAEVTEVVRVEDTDGVRPVPIATSGDLHMMPPSTGLPTPRGRGGNPLGGGLLESIPEVAPMSHDANKIHGSSFESSRQSAHEVNRETGREDSRETSNLAGQEITAHGD